LKKEFNKQLRASLLLTLRQPAHRRLLAKLLTAVCGIPFCPIYEWKEVFFSFGENSLPKAPGAKKVTIK
jgi:hypothetical protein